MNTPGSFLSRTEILDAAEQTLRKYGPDKASVTDVAKLLGVSHGTLYRHFPSKAALREAVTERWLEDKIVAPLSEIAGVPAREGDALEQLGHYMTTLTELKYHYAAKDSEMFRMYAAVTEESAGLIEIHIGRILDQISTIMDRGMKQKLISGETAAEDLARSVFYATARFHHPAHAYEWNRPGTRQEFARLWTLLVRGLMIH